MSSSQAPTTTARADAPGNVSLPSETVQPTEVSTPPQQGSTQPGDGSTVHYDAEKNVQYVEQPGGKVPWKDQVLGYAKEIRGATLRKPETKEQGQKILQGQEAPSETHK